MPAPIYFHPFSDHNHNINFGPAAIRNMPSWVSLGAVAPTITRRTFNPAKCTAHYKYLWKMGAASTTFANYANANHRIFVLGHCRTGSDEHSTETGAGAPADTCSASDLGDIFAAHGLPQASQVSIRIHACGSGSRGPLQIPSFAEELMTYMSATLGYNIIVVRGYDVATSIYLFRRWGGGYFGNANAHLVEF